LALGLWTAILVALVVVLAAWIAGRIAEDQERDRIDTRLAANLTAANQAFKDTLEQARSQAKRLATDPEVQRALADRDRAAAAAIVDHEEATALLAGGTVLAGRASWIASRLADVVAEERELGSVVVGVPLDQAQASHLGEAAGITRVDILAIADHGKTLAASGALARGSTVPTGDSGEVEEDGEGYRFVSTSLLQGEDVRLVVLSPDEPIGDAGATARRRAFLAALATALLAVLVGWTIARLIGRREPRAEPAVRAAQRRRAADVRPGDTDERRVREAVALLGDALAATHDPEALLPVILQSAIGATGATGARLVSGEDEVIRVGRPERGGKPLTLRLGSDDEGIGHLLLYPPRDGSFDQEAEELAHWLAAQASIALENERLHRTVKLQAITDELTQLANRRRFTETLSVEVRRAERFGDPLTLLLADLDDFKQINDRYGHQAGDEVLRRFADVLRENVRDFDLPVRYGGEEFAVLLPETGPDGGEQLARRLQAALLRLRLPWIAGDRPPVTASFGVASFPFARTAEDLLSAADEALYRAKEEGKNRVAVAGEA
jgi:diguanylate cyclase (GGDEF)-like protein